MLWREVACVCPGDECFEEVCEAAAVLVAPVLEEVGEEFGDPVFEALFHLLAKVGEVDPLAACVAGVGAAFDESVFGEGCDGLADGAFAEADALGEFALDGGPRGDEGFHDEDVLHAEARWRCGASAFVHGLAEGAQAGEDGVDQFFLHGQGWLSPSQMVLA